MDDGDDQVDEWPEASAKPDLEQAGVGRSPREGEECDDGRDLEEARLDSSAGVEDFGEQRRKLLVADQLAGDADSFVEADQVGTGEDVDSMTGGLERRAEEGDRRSLAVRPGDVEHRRQAILGTAETFEERRNPL